MRLQVKRGGGAVALNRCGQTLSILVAANGARACSDDVLEHHRVRERTREVRGGSRSNRSRGNRWEKLGAKQGTMHPWSCIE